MVSLCASKDPSASPGAVAEQIHPSIPPSIPRRFSCGCTFGKRRCGLGEGDRLHCDIKTATLRTWKIHLHLLGAAKPPEPPQGHQQRFGGSWSHRGVSKWDKHGAVASRSFLHKTPPPVSRVFLSLMWKTSPQEPQDGETRKRKRSVKPGSFGQALEKDGWKRLQATA